MFRLHLPFKLAGDQPKAVKELTAAFRGEKRQNVLLGVTGSGKTATMSALIEELQAPALVVSPNKTLAAQLYQEFRDFFPENAVHYFVSYYDYYQPEAYLPPTDTYIEKDVKINEEIDKLRHAATADILTRGDVIVVASVSCIYGIGGPEAYEQATIEFKTRGVMPQKGVLRRLADLQYERSDLDPRKGNYRVRGDMIEIYPPAGERFYRIEWHGDAIETITEHTLTAREQKGVLHTLKVFPAKHFVTPREKLELALANIEAELEERLAWFRERGKLIEAQRLEERTRFDLEMLRETGYCHGIENYSRPLSFRNPGEPPSTLIDYFNYAYNSGIRNKELGIRNNWLLMIDESHITVPQLHAMYPGDRSRKQVLVEYGFRLPSAIDNRPLQFEEFEGKIGAALYVSATPGGYEFGRARKEGVVAEQIVRPTGLLDPTIEIKPTAGQIQDLITQIRGRAANGQRTLVTTLTKRLAEDIAEYLAEADVKVEYLHSDIKTLLRPEILNNLRKGKYDVIVGINLLREGLDLPEVSLVAILDADKEGFLRNETTLIQTMGRAARHQEGHIIMYADNITGSMQRAISEIDRRRAVQRAYNEAHGMTPQSIQKAIRDYALPSAEKKIAERAFATELKTLEPLLRGEVPLKVKEVKGLIKQLKSEMRAAAEALNFERAAVIRDTLQKIGKGGRLKFQVPLSR